MKTMIKGELILKAIKIDNERVELSIRCLDEEGDPLKFTLVVLEKGDSVTISPTFWEGDENES